MRAAIIDNVSAPKKYRFRQGVVSRGLAKGLDFVADNAEHYIDNAKSTATPKWLNEGILKADLGNKNKKFV